MSAFLGWLVIVWNSIAGAWNDVTGNDIFKTVVVSVLVAGLTYVIARVIEEWQARQKWLRRDALHRINFSLNRFTTAGELKLRSVCELPLEDVVHNSNTRKKLLTWAKAVKSADDDPVLTVSGEAQTAREKRSWLEEHLASWKKRILLKFWDRQLTEAEVIFINNCALNTRPSSSP